MLSFACNWNPAWKPSKISHRHFVDMGNIEFKVLEETTCPKGVSREVREQPYSRNSWFVC